MSLVPPTLTTIADVCICLTVLAVFSLAGLRPAELFLDWRARLCVVVIELQFGAHLVWVITHIEAMVHLSLAKVRQYLSYFFARVSTMLMVYMFVEVKVCPLLWRLSKGLTPSAAHNYAEALLERM